MDTFRRAGNIQLFDLVGLQLSARIRDMGKLTLCRAGATVARKHGVSRWNLRRALNAVSN